MDFEWFRLLDELSVFDIGEGLTADSKAIPEYVQASGVTRFGIQGQGLQRPGAGAPGLGDLGATTCPVC